MDYALLVVFVGAIAVGVVSAVVKTWAFHQRLYSLEDRMGVLEGVQTREVKIRAAQSRLPKATSDEALMAQLQASPVQTKKKNWWEVPVKG